MTIRNVESHYGACAISGGHMSHPFVDTTNATSRPPVIPYSVITGVASILGAIVLGASIGERLAIPGILSFVSGCATGVALAWLRHGRK